METLSDQGKFEDDKTATPAKIRGTGDANGALHENEMMI